ncbi:hypothetical protein ACTA71_010299 [Dictyostelium dimigraforme]
MNNNNDENENGAELKPFRGKELESSLINDYRQYDVFYKLDLDFSLAFLIVGIFSWVPLFFNFFYIRSQNVHARRISVASLVIASSYFVVAFIMTVISTIFG